MPYKPIPGAPGAAPGQVDVPSSELTQKALARASNLLVPYQQRFGLKPIAAPTAPAVPEAAVSPAADSRLYEAIHPETFAKVLETIMQLVTGRPIPREEGGELEPGKVYNTGEKGPETIVMNPGGGGYALPTGAETGGRYTYPGAPMSPRVAGRVEGLSGSPADVVSPNYGMTFPPAAQKIKELMGPSVSPMDIEMVPYPWIGGGGGAGGGGVPAPTGTVNLTDLAPGQETGPGGGGFGPSIPGGGAPVPPTELQRQGYTQYGGPEAGINYKLGAEYGTSGYGIPVARPASQSPEEVELGARERWAQPGYPERALAGARAAAPGANIVGVQPGFQRSYYEAHPAEAEAQTYYDMMRPSPDDIARENMEVSRLESQAKDRNLPKTARVGAVARLNQLREGMAARDQTLKKMTGEIYATGIRESGQGAETEERLAHAEYMRNMPGVELQKAREANQASMQQTLATVKGHIEAAQITAGARNQILTGLNTWLSNKEKFSSLYNQSFDPVAEAAQYMRLMKDIGQISEEDWARMPAQWKQERMITFKGKGGTFNIPESQAQSFGQSFPQYQRVK